MRPLFLDHERVMTSNQLTFQVQKRTIPKNSDTGKSVAGKMPLSPDSLTAAPPPRRPRRSRAGAVCLGSAPQASLPRHRVGSFRGLPRSAPALTRNCVDFGWRGRLGFGL
jgi:hypothetical protein